MWRGFAVEPQQGDPTPFIEHAQAVCGEDGAAADYMLNWMAFSVQRPGTQPEVALVLRGGQGTGKGTLGRLLLRFFGPHGRHLTQQRHLVGNFNAHLHGALVVFADEAFFAGDKQAEGALKGLITEPTITIEPKGVDAFTAPNQLKVIIASNSRWVVPAGADERRYAVVEVSDGLAGNHEYFERVNRWIAQGGDAIALHYLLNRDISEFNPRVVPKTAGLDRQKLEGLPVLDRWIVNALDTDTPLDGRSTEPGGWCAEVKCEGALQSLVSYASAAGARYQKLDSRTIGLRLIEVFGCEAATLTRAGGRRVRAWKLPLLDEARRCASRAYGLAAYEWGRV